MKQIRVLLVDDHAVVRAGLRAILEVEDDIAVVAEAADGDAAVREALAANPAVVIMDVRMGPTDGIQACREIKSERDGIGVLMLTSFGGAEAVVAALMAGASGFLLKNTGRDELLRAIRAVARGESLLDAAATRQITNKIVDLAAGGGAPLVSRLSDREREVLTLVAQGHTNKEIAGELVISKVTARNHVSHILEKLGMSRRSEAAAFAAQMGLLDQPST